MMQTMGWLDWKRYRGEETLAGGSAECWLDWMSAGVGGSDVGEIGNWDWIKVES